MWPEIYWKVTVGYTNFVKGSVLKLSKCLNLRNKELNDPESPTKNLQM